MGRRTKCSALGFRSVSAIASNSRNSVPYSECRNYGYRKHGHFRDGHELRQTLRNAQAVHLAGLGYTLPLGLGFSTCKTRQLATAPGPAPRPPDAAFNTRPPSWRPSRRGHRTPAVNFHPFPLSFRLKCFQATQQNAEKKKLREEKQEGPSDRCLCNLTGTSSPFLK